MIILQHGEHGAVPLLVDLLQETNSLLLYIHLRCVGSFPTMREGVKLLLEEGYLLSRSLIKLGEYAKRFTLAAAWRVAMST